MSSMAPLSGTERTRIHRLGERASSDRADLYAVLDAGLICHLGVIVDGCPVVLPTGYGRIGDTLYLHGSSGSRSLRAAGGQEICVTVTHLDGLVCARAVFHNSMNYRSAVVLGTGRLVTDEPERIAALRAVTEQLISGRWENSRPPSRKELAATAVIALPLAEASVKIRTGPPKDEPEDYDTGFWAGVLPATLVIGPAEPDPALRPGVPVPGHITAQSARTGHAAE